MTRLLPMIALLLAPAARAADEPERVVMKLDEFLKLYELGKDRPDDPEKAPHDYAIASARYKGEVVTKDGEPTSAVFTGRMRVEVLKAEGWTRIPLLPVSVALKSARVGGKEAPIALHGGWYHLVTDRRGAFDVDLEFAASVFTSEGSSGLSFQLAPSGGTEVELAVPADESLDFTVANARQQDDRVQGARRIVVATLPATGSLAVSWQRAIPEAEQQPPRLYAESTTLVGLGDGLLQATTTLHHTILFSGVDELRARIPDGMTLLDVKGAGIRDWTLGEDGVLAVQLNYAAEGAYPLTVELERVIGEGSLVTEVPLVEPLGVERSKGWVGVQAIGNLEIAPGEVEGAAPVDVRTLPAGILGVTSQPVLLGYKFLGTGAKIPLTVEAHEDVDVLVTLLDQAMATTMWTRDGRRLTSVRYQVRNNRKQFLRLELPVAAELWSASVGGKAVQPARAGDGRVLVPLVRSQASGGALAAFQVEVVYVEPGQAPDERGRGTFHASLPRADVPSTYVGWTVYAPYEAKIHTRGIEGTLRNVEGGLTRPIPPAQVHAIQTVTPDVQQQAAGQARSGGLGEGAAPVQVSLPLDGRPLHFEKLLALDELLEVSFRFKGLDD